MFLLKLEEDQARACAIQKTVPEVKKNQQTKVLKTSVAEPPLFWAAPAPDFQGPRADSEKFNYLYKLFWDYNVFLNLTDFIFT